MYPLMPKSWWAGGVALVTLLTWGALFLVDLFRLPITDWRAVVLVGWIVPAVFLYLFAGAYWWAPWRVAWRLLPNLNQWVFPDLNGVWVGTTNSNWPTITRMLEAAGAEGAVGPDELDNVPPQQDVIAVHIRSSLTMLKIAASLTSTNAQSHSTTARPMRDPNSDQLHVTYVYEQDTPVPVKSDEGRHQGAADVVFDFENLTTAEGVYWTRRRWNLGLNTAGQIKLERVTSRKDPKKSLAGYAAEARRKRDQA